MTHEAEQDRMAAQRREWDKQSIYLRRRLGDPPDLRPDPRMAGARRPDRARFYP